MGRKARAEATFKIAQQSRHNATSEFRTASTTSIPKEDPKYDKDAEELDLEKLVFGDDEGFQAALGSEVGQQEFPRDLGEDATGADSEDGAEVQSDIEEVADEDVSACMSSEDRG